jgi:hypothetical protein
MTVSFTDLSATIWMTLEFKGARGKGRVAPSLVLEFEATTQNQDCRVELHHLQGKLYSDFEYLGQGFIEFRTISSNGTRIEMQVPLAPALFGYINEKLTGDATIGLTISFSGAMRIWHDLDRAYASSPPRGEWTFVGIGDNHQTGLKFQIARSDWFKYVLEPIGMDEYVFAEIKIPKGLLKSKFTAAAQSVLKAESHFVNGDDPEVFFQCRAALETLTGAPKSIFDSVADEGKRQALNDLVQRLVDLLHRGRHAQPEKGFMVNHQDAELALSLTKVVLAYISKSLPA